MLRRRPDIRVAERQLAASNAEIGVAVGDYFPKVTFTGSFGYDAASLNGLGTGASRAYSIGPGISWAAFDLGRVHAQVAGARARTDTALAQYEQTVLKALEETENALVTHARTRDQLVHAADAAEASAAAAKLARVRYEGGVVDFLEVLDAERTQLEAEDRMAQSRTAGGNQPGCRVQSVRRWLGGRALPALHSGIQLDRPKGCHAEACSELDLTPT